MFLPSGLRWTICLVASLALLVCLASQGDSNDKKGSSAPSKGKGHKKKKGKKGTGNKGDKPPSGNVPAATPGAPGSPTAPGTDPAASSTSPPSATPGNDPAASANSPALGTDPAASANPATAAKALAASGPDMGLVGHYYEGPYMRNLSATRTDAKIDFDFNQTPAPGPLGNHHFSVIWTGQLLPRFSETYTFTTSTAGGLRLFINGQLLIDNFTEHTLRDDSATVTLDAGKKADIGIEYFKEHLGPAKIQLSWSSASQQKEIIPQSQLFPVADAAPLAVPDSYTVNNGPTIPNIKKDAGDGVLANDRAPDGKPLQAFLVKPPEHGTLNLRKDGSFEYIPFKGFTGKDSFEYKAQKPNGMFANAVARLQQEKTQPQKDFKATARGLVTWNITAKTPLGNQIDADFTFVPTKTNCKNITFLQVVTPTLGGNITFPIVKTADDKEIIPADDYFKKYVAGASYLDTNVVKGFASQDTDPYFGADFNAGKKIWVDEPARGVLGTGADGKKTAKMTDEVINTLARNGMELVAKFETVVFCIDRQEVLAVITWGMTIPGNKEGPIVLDKVEIKEEVSDSFRAAIKQANDVQGTKVMVAGKERTLNVMLHGQLNGNPTITGPSVLPK